MSAADHRQMLHRETERSIYVGEVELGTGVQGALERSSSDIQCVSPAPDTPPNVGGAGVQRRI